MATPLIRYATLLATMGGAGTGWPDGALRAGHRHRTGRADGCAAGGGRYRHRRARRSSCWGLSTHIFFRSLTRNAPI